VKPALEFSVPVVASLKNSRKITFRRGRIRTEKSDAAKASLDEVRVAALQQIRRISKGIGQGSLFGDDDVAVRVRYDADKELCHVRVQSMGPKPQGRTGRSRDLQNLIEAICDGLNGIAWDDDRQVTVVVMRRRLRAQAGQVGARW